MTPVNIEPACRRMEHLNPIYREIWERAFAEAIPISGTFELTPRCNFNCRMCYVHLPESKISNFGREMSAEEWVKVAWEAKKTGTIWLCITGGEPLMHPGFETIWRELTQMGFFITLQTNAALVIRHENLFAEYPPWACKITVYGSNDAAYREVCGADRGFTDTDAGIRMLRQMDVPVKLVTTVIRQNYDDVHNIIQYADSLKLNWYPNLNIRPSSRGADSDVEVLRVNTRQKVRDKSYQAKSSEQAEFVYNPPMAYCKDYRVGYWIVWNGYMRFCSFLNGPDIDIRLQSFRKCWEQLVRLEDGLEWPKECGTCPIKGKCTKCAASCKMQDGALYISENYCKIQKQL